MFTIYFGVLFVVTSCLDLREEGKRRSGIYDISFGDEKRKVFCDMNTLGGGWTVIQRRGDFGNAPDFFLRNWTEYRNGFGRPDRELWIGLEAMFLLSNVEPVQVSIIYYLVKVHSVFKTCRCMNEYQLMDIA